MRIAIDSYSWGERLLGLRMVVVVVGCGCGMGARYGMGTILGGGGGGVVNGWMDGCIYVEAVDYYTQLVEILEHTNRDS